MLAARTGLIIPEMEEWVMELMLCGSLSEDFNVPIYAASMMDSR
jgi:hypothetical protein